MVEGKIENKTDKNVRIFNSPVEVGIRSLIVLSELYPDKIDFQKLLYFDYLLVNSGDVENGPDSLHPKIPFRSSSIGIRRKDLSDGLDILVSKDLLKKEYLEDLGVMYAANELTAKFLSHFGSDYYDGLAIRAKWIKDKFSRKSATEIEQIINKREGSWRAEFSNDSFTRDDWYIRNDY